MREGGFVAENVDGVDDWYDIVRRSDGRVMSSFCGERRHLVYRQNGIISLRPMLEEELVFTHSSMVKFLKRCGYGITPPPDNLIS